MKTVKEYIEQGNTKSAARQLAVVMDDYKVRGTSDAVRKEVADLYSSGFTSVMPNNFIEEIEGDDGIKVKLSEEQIDIFRTYYDEAASAANNLINLTDYKKMSKGDRAKALKKLFDAYYYFARSAATGSSTNSKLSSLLLMSNGKFNVYKYCSALVMLSSITNSAVANKKESITRAVNKLQNFNRTEKILLVSLAGYSPNETNSRLLNNYLKRYGIENMF